MISKYDELASHTSFCFSIKSWQNHQPVDFQKNSSQKILSKNSSQKKSSQKIPTKKPSKIPKNFIKMSTNFLLKILRFWKYPIPYIALRGRKPFRACFFVDSKIVKTSLTLDMDFGNVEPLLALPQLPVEPRWFHVV